jgi:hypothetical protein
MKPLILEFQESPTGESHDYSMIEYDDVLNLNVDKNTGLPAIDSISMETETFTKADGEGADSDRNGFNSFLITETGTKDDSEDTDSDKNGFNSIMVTETGTFASLEGSDSDRDIASIHSLLETQTHTRDYMEVSDSDPR